MRISNNSKVRQNYHCASRGNDATAKYVIWQQRYLSSLPLSFIWRNSSVSFMKRASKELCFINHHLGAYTKAKGKLNELKGNEWIYYELPTFLFETHNFWQKNIPWHHKWFMESDDKNTQEEQTSSKSSKDLHIWLICLIKSQDFKRLIIECQGCR